MLVSKAALEAGRTVAIYSLPKLLARIRRTYDSEPGGDSYLSFFERLTSVDLLHIDDLGAEKRSDWVLEQLYALDQRALRVAALGADHHQPRARSSWKSRSARAPSRA